MKSILLSGMGLAGLGVWMIVFPFFILSLAVPVGLSFLLLRWYFRLGSRGVQY